jgi:hypothetical protein
MSGKEFGSCLEVGPCGPLLPPFYGGASEDLEYFSPECNKSGSNKNATGTDMKLKDNIAI